MRARREVLELPDLPRSFLRFGLSSKRRVQLTFSSSDVSKAFGKLDAPRLVLVTDSFVRAHREPLETSDLPPSFSDARNSSKRRAQFNFSSNDVSKAFGELDAPHLVLVTILSCALVVRCLSCPAYHVAS